MTKATTKTTPETKAEQPTTVKPATKATKAKRTASTVKEEIAKAKAPAKPKAKATPKQTDLPLGGVVAKPTPAEPLTVIGSRQHVVPSETHTVKDEATALILTSLANRIHELEHANKVKENIKIDEFVSKKQNLSVTLQNHITIQTRVQTTKRNEPSALRVEARIAFLNMMLSLLTAIDDIVELLVFEQTLNAYLMYESIPTDL